MTRPRVGMIPDFHDNEYVPEPSLGCLNGLDRAGAKPVLIDYHIPDAELIRLIDRLDGLLLQGGDDVEPSLYGEAPLPECGNFLQLRDQVECRALELAMARDLPVMGICRGTQLLNVALGGTLYQDLPSQLGFGHHQTEHDGFWHGVRLLPGSLAAGIAGANELTTNSYHHQSVKALAPSLVATAWSGDGVIEAIERPASRFFLGLQWHPEVTLARDDVSQKFFDAFTNACKEGQHVS